MALKTIILQLFCLFAISLCCYGQKASRFLHLTTKDGLPSNYVFSADEDEHGFLWIGTDKGLVRYDGFRWQTFTTDEGLPGNYINHVFCDNRGGIWLYCATKGLYHYTINTGIGKLVSKTVIPSYICTDTLGNLFYYLMPSTSSPAITAWYVLATQPEKPQQVFEFPADMPWGYAVDVNKKTLQLIPYLHKTPKLPAYKTFKKEWKVEFAKRVIDQPGFFKIIAPGIIANTTTLYNLRSETQKLQLFPHNNAYLNAVQTAEGVWINNERDGLYLLDQQWQTTHFTAADGLTSSMVTGMHVMNNDRLLLTTLGGGILYKLSSGDAIISTGGKQIKSLATNGDNIYAASVNEVLVIHSLLHDPLAKFATIEQNVQAINVWDNEFYVSHLGGFSRYRITDGRFTRQQLYSIGAGISNVVKAGDRYFAGSFGNHVLEIKNNRLVADTASRHVSERLYTIPNGYASLSLEEGVILCYNDGRKINLTTREGLPSNAVYHVHANKDTLWISTKGGVAAFAQNKIVNTIKPGEGFKGSHSFSTFHDTTNSMWIVSDGYLTKYAPGKSTYFSAAVIRNNAHDIPFPSVYAPASHSVVTGGFDNIYITSLHNLTRPNVLRKPALRHAMADGKEVGETFSLPNNYHQLVFHFKPATANPFTKTHLYYRLEGSPEGFKEIKDSLSLSLPALRSGEYKLVAKAINEYGVETPEVVLSSFTIQRSFWQAPLTLLLIVASGIAITYFISKQRQRRKLAAIHKEKQILLQVSNERDRISKELHDNLGSSLTTIIAQTDNLETKLKLNKADEALDKVQQLSTQARETMNILRETIWAVQEPEHEMDTFINRIRNFLQRVFSVTSIEWTLDATVETGMKLSSEQTLHLFRSIQEITQNIIKHSGATLASYKFAAQPHQLEVLISDNGQGFDAKQSFNSNGLKNIDSRMEAIHGKVTVTSIPNSGTEILLTLSI